MRVFFQVSAMNSSWEKIFDEIYDSIISSKILNDPNNSLYIGFVGNEKAYNTILNKVKVKADIVNHGSDFKRYEFPTLEALEDYAKVSNEALMYVHTKGVSKPDSVSKKYWRRAMVKYIINEWKQCLEKLKTCDAVGYNLSEYKNKSRTHFSGNFWVTTSSFIRSCTSIRELQKNPFVLFKDQDSLRFQAEFWLKTGITAKTKFVSVGVDSSFKQHLNEWEIDPSVILDRDTIDPFKASNIKLDRIYAINLIESVNRKNSVLTECFIAGLENVIVYPAFNGKRKNLTSKSADGGIIGCWSSHEAILTEAFVNSYDNILIIEDDAKFVYGFRELLAEALKDVPEDWELIWLGSYEKSGLPKFVKNRIAIPKDCWGTQCYLVNKKGIEKIVKSIKNANSIMDIDIFIHKFVPELKQYTIFPTLVKQVGFKSTVRP